MIRDDATVILRSDGVGPKNRVISNSNPIMRSFAEFTLIPLESGRSAQDDRVTKGGNS